MKVKTLLGVAIVGLSIASCSGEDPKTVEQTIEVKDTDGEKEVTITTTTDGATTTESYTGDEADAKAKEVTKKTTPVKKDAEIEFKKVTKDISKKGETTVKEEVKRDTTVVLKKTIRGL